VKLWLGALALFCAVAHAQTDEELATDAKLTISYFECSWLASEKDKRAAFMARGLKVGRAFLAAIDADPKGRRIAKLQMPMQLFAEGPSIDFRLGQTYGLIGETSMQDFDISAHSNEQYKAEQDRQFKQRNCALLPK
jgi:hypothetical protein